MKDDNNKLYIVAFVAIVAIMALAYMFNPNAITTTAEKIKLNSEDIACDMVITKLPTGYENLGYTCQANNESLVGQQDYQMCAKCLKESNTVGMGYYCGGSRGRRMSWWEYLVYNAFCDYPS